MDVRRSGFVITFISHCVSSGRNTNGSGTGGGFVTAFFHFVCRLGFGCDNVVTARVCHVVAVAGRIRARDKENAAESGDHEGPDL
ncbi:MAG: hypothetical protein ACC628_26525 [Pirellulaceae bacterium]